MPPAISAVRNIYRLRFVWTLAMMASINLRNQFFWLQLWFKAFYHTKCRGRGFPTSAFTCPTSPLVRRPYHCPTSALPFSVTVRYGGAKLDTRKRCKIWDQYSMKKLMFNSRQRYIHIAHWRTGSLDPRRAPCDTMHDNAFSRLISPPVTYYL